MHSLPVGRVVLLMKTTPLRGSEYMWLPPSVQLIAKIPYAACTVEIASHKDVPSLEQIPYAGCTVKICFHNGLPLCSNYLTQDAPLKSRLTLTYRCAMS